MTSNPLSDRNSARNVNSPCALGIFARYPHPGAVKTRLAASLGEQRAAELYAAFVADTLDRFRTAGDGRWICHTPSTAESVSYFRDLAGGDYELWPQPEGSLGERLAAFFASRFASGVECAVVVGSDSPTLPREYVDSAFGLLSGTIANVRRVPDSQALPAPAEPPDCLIGPATDGGYYLIGMRGRLLPVFSDIDWSTPVVLIQTIERLNEIGASFAFLPPWVDVDEPRDLDLLRGHLAALRTGGEPIPERTVAVLDQWDD